MAEAKRDQNRIPAILGTSNADGSTTLPVYVDSSTNRLLVSTNSVDVAQTQGEAYQAGDAGVMMFVVRQDSQSNLGDDGDFVPLTVNSSGELRVTTGSGTTYTEDAAKSGDAEGGTVMMVRDDVLSTITPAEGDWNPLRSSAEGALWVQDINSDDALTALQAIDTDVTTIIGHVDGIEALLTTIDADTSSLAGAVDGTEVQVDVVAPLPAGTNTIGKLAANSGVDIGDVDVTSISAGSNLIGDVNLQARTGGGALSIFRSIDLDESEEEVKASAGAVYGYYFANLADSTRYLKLYNATAANVTVGTTTPVLTLPLPAGQSGHISFSYGLNFSTAITVAATTGLADNDTGAPGANEVVINIFYK